jgi:hypothetical protein
MYIYIYIFNALKAKNNREYLGENNVLVGGF